MMNKDTMVNFRAEQILCKRLHICKKDCQNSLLKEDNYFESFLQLE